MPRYQRIIRLVLAGILLLSLFSKSVLLHIDLFHLVPVDTTHLFAWVDWAGEGYFGGIDITIFAYLLLLSRPRRPLSSYQIGSTGPVALSLGLVGFVVFGVLSVVSTQRWLNRLYRVSIVLALASMLPSALFCAGVLTGDEESLSLLPGFWIAAGLVCIAGLLEVVLYKFRRGFVPSLKHG